jgi:hypothetical protein
MVQMVQMGPMDYHRIRSQSQKGSSATKRPGWLHLLGLPVLRVLMVPQVRKVTRDRPGQQVRQVRTGQTEH